LPHDPQLDCPLCRSPGPEPFFADARDYYRCGVCQLVFVPLRFVLSPAEEKSVYDQHQNSPDDAGYRTFLSRLCDPICQRLAPGSRGLDFGSGPGPTLSVILTEAGHQVAIYDPFYAPDQSPLRPPPEALYDFITASEVVEHLRHPGAELERLWRILNPGGLLGVMTKRVLDREAFSRWHYKNDPTHIRFFSAATFEYLAEHWRAELAIVGDDVVLFRKSALR